MSYIPAPVPLDRVFRRKVEEQLARLLELAGPEEEVLRKGLWRPNGNSDGVKAFAPTDSFPAARGDGTIPFPVAALMDLLIDVTKKGETDSQCERGAVLQRIDDHTTISYLKYKGIGFVAGRDFCNLATWKVEESGRVIIVASAHEDASVCPEVKGAVRGLLDIGGWVLTPIDSRSTAATYLMRSDFRGSIPGWVTRSVAAQQSSVVAVLRETLKKKYRDADGFLSFFRRNMVASGSLPDYLGVAGSGGSEMPTISNVNPEFVSARSASATTSATSATPATATAIEASRSPSSPPVPADAKTQPEAAGGPTTSDEPPSFAPSTPVRSSSAVAAVAASPARAPVPAPASASTSAPTTALQPSPGQSPGPASIRLFPLAGSSGEASATGRFSPDAFVSTADLGGAVGGLAFRTELPPMPPLDEQPRGNQAWRVAESASAYVLSLLSDPVLAMLRMHKAASSSSSSSTSSSLLVDSANPSAHICLSCEASVPAAPLTILNLLTSSPSAGASLLLGSDSFLSFSGSPVEVAGANEELFSSPQFRLLQETFCASDEGAGALLRYRTLQHYRVIALPSSSARPVGKQHGILLLRASIVADDDEGGEGAKGKLRQPLFIDALVITLRSLPRQPRQQDLHQYRQASFGASSFSSDASSSPPSAHSSCLHLFCTFGHHRHNMEAQAALRLHWQKTASLFLRRLSEGLAAGHFAEGNAVWRQSKRQDHNSLASSSSRGPFLKGLSLSQALAGFLSPFGLLENQVVPTVLAAQAQVQANASRAALSQAKAGRGDLSSFLPVLAAVGVAVGAVVFAFRKSKAQSSSSSPLPLSMTVAPVAAVLLALAILLVYCSARSSAKGKESREAIALRSASTSTSARAAASGSSEALRFDPSPLLSLWFRAQDAAASALPAGLPTLVAKAAAMALKKALGPQAKEATAVVVFRGGASPSFVLRLESASNLGLTEAAFLAVKRCSSSTVSAIADADVLVVFDQGDGNGRAELTEEIEKEKEGALVSSFLLSVPVESRLAVVLRVDASALATSLRALRTSPPSSSHPASSSPPSSSSSLRSTRHAAAFLGHPKFSLDPSFVWSKTQSKPAAGAASTQSKGGEREAIEAACCEALRGLLSSSSALLLAPHSSVSSLSTAGAAE